MMAENKYHFRINLVSLWANDGEDGIRYDAPIGESLGKAAKIADQKFMAQNHRGDVQASRSAYLIIENEKGEKLEAIYFEHPREAEKRRERRKANSTREDRSNSQIEA